MYGPYMWSRTVGHLPVTVALGPGPRAPGRAGAVFLMRAPPPHSGRRPRPLLARLDLDYGARHPLFPKAERPRRTLAHVEGFLFSLSEALEKRGGVFITRVLTEVKEDLGPVQNGSTDGEVRLPGLP